MVEIRTKLYTTKTELTLLDIDNASHFEYLKKHFRYVAEDNDIPDVEQYLEEVLVYIRSKGIARLNGESLGRPLWYLIADKATPTGFVGFISMINRCPVTDAGWAIATPHQRKGYASEAAKEVLRYCTQELGMIEVWAAVSPDNIGSQKIAESCGLIKASTTVRCNTRDSPEMLCYILPGMEAFPQDTVYLRRGDNDPFQVPS